MEIDSPLFLIVLSPGPKQHLQVRLFLANELDKLLIDILDSSIILLLD